MTAKVAPLPTPPPSYFHCAPTTLSPGSVIHPGNWGRILNLYETNNGQINLSAANEGLLEWARRSLAPTKPSRLASVFTLPSLQEAVDFRNKHQRLSIIHEVEPTEQNPNRHDGDYEIAITPYRARYFPQMFDFPNVYWTQTATANREILFGCSVRVISLPNVPPV
jgi:hypothetical protein